MLSLLIVACSEGMSGGLGPCSEPSKATPHYEFAKFVLYGDYAVAHVSAWYTGNPGTVNLDLTGIPTTGWPIAAYLFWHAQTYTSDQYASITFNGNPITGNVGGTDCTDCWPPAESSALYWADVTQFVSGNGTYTVSGYKALGPDAPGVNGFSLVVIYCDSLMTQRRAVSVWIGDVDLTGCGPDSYSWTQSGFTASNPITSAKATLVISECQDGSLNSAYFNGNFLKYFDGNPPQEHYGWWDGDVSAWMSGGDTQVSWSVSTDGSDCIAPIITVLSVSTDEPESYSCALGVKESPCQVGLRFWGVREGVELRGKPGTTLLVEVFSPDGRLAKAQRVTLGPDGRGRVPLARGLWLVRAGNSVGEVLVR